MKRRWKYLLAAVLLAAGLLAGCTGGSGQPSQDVQGMISQSAGASSAEVQSGEEQNSGTPSTEEQSTGAPSAEGQGAGAESSAAPLTELSLSEDGTYTSKEDVAGYIALYGHLPANFITKKEAKALGWVSSEGNLGKVAPGKSIGGDYFGNYEGHLPEKKGRDYHECDIDSSGGYRGAKRIVYSNDGLIYYTEDHYETFELLYGEE